MTCTRIKLSLAAVMSMAGLLCADALSAQIARTSFSAGLAISTRYPDRFHDGCESHAGIAPSVRLHHRLNRIVTAELGLAALTQLPPGVYSSCADAVPLMDGEVARFFDNSRGSMSLAGEARIVLTPMAGNAGLRIIGGGGWFPQRRAPAWILGLGYRPSAAGRGLFLDVEWWTVGVTYDLERYRMGAPRERLDSGREWQGFWQLRAGFRL